MLSTLLFSFTVPALAGQPAGLIQKVQQGSGDTASLVWFNADLVDQVVDNEVGGATYGLLVTDGDVVETAVFGAKATLVCTQDTATAELSCGYAGTVETRLLAAGALACR
jgi:hypothetical protein